MADQSKHLTPEQVAAKETAMAHRSGPFGINLLCRRRQRDLTQAQLAERSGVDRTTIAKIESGDTKNPGASTVVALAGALGVSTTALWYEPASHLTPAQISERYQVSLKTLANWRSMGTGPRFFRAGRAPLYKLEDVLAWEASRTLARGARAARKAA